MPQSNALLADPDTLTAILTYHVVAGSVDSQTAQTLAGTAVETVSGEKVRIDHS